MFFKEKTVPGGRIGQLGVPEFPERKERSHSGLSCAPLYRLNNQLCFTLPQSPHVLVPPPSLLFPPQSSFLLFLDNPTLTINS